ncbi:hypothetical protein ACLB2K_031920 [Fragaria x ananassa]
MTSPFSITARTTSTFPVSAIVPPPTLLYENGVAFLYHNNSSSADVTSAYSLRPLPCLFWSYPGEFKSKDAAGQVRGSPNEFAGIGPTLALLWMARRFAILSDQLFLLLVRVMRKKMIGGSSKENCCWGTFIWGVHDCKPTEHLLLSVFRWYNHLSPAIIKDAWTEVEERMLAFYHQQYGNKWAEISRFLHGRLIR